MSIFRPRRRTAQEPNEGSVGEDREIGTEREPRAYARAQPPERTAEAAPERRRSRWRPREARAAAVGSVGSGVIAIARLVLSIAGLIALLIALAVVLRDVDANAHNTIVKGIHEGANFFAGAFTGLVTIKGHAKREITVDWGIAIVVYLIVGALISRSIARVGRSGQRYERSRRLAS
jgi:hypothetical protein